MSPDAAIAIVFGLIGAIISFVGVVIAYLTLRSMTMEKCTLPCSILASSDVNGVTKGMSNTNEEIAHLFGMRSSTSSHYLKNKELETEIRRQDEAGISTTLGVLLIAGLNVALRL